MKLINLISPLSYHHLFLRRIFGKKQKNVDLFETRRSFEDMTPVFILSTGRCGTKWIDEIISTDESVVSLHHPIPVMRSQARICYNYDFNKASNSEKQLLREMFLGGREELFNQALKVNKNLIFTDSRQTFFAEVIRDIFPKAKFVHLHRNPGQVIKSGMERDWYDAENSSELNRIKPDQGDFHFDKWSEYDLIQKNSWLWNETNKWILNFLETVPSNQQFTLSFNKWNSTNLSEMFQFCGASISESLIQKRRNARVNVQKTAKFKKFEEWAEADKEKVRSICGDTSSKLGYSI